MYSEDELLPISALQHFAFCERQCALIHLELLWDENRLTAEGRILHEKVHEREDESRGDIRIARGLRLRSLEFGLIGQADVVESHAINTPDNKTLWQPFPIEYKRGKPKPDVCDKIQLCAQAICLEEMLGVSVPEGAVFYGQPRRRMAVEFTNPLRAETAEISERLHALVKNGKTPPAQYEKKCKNCSLFSLCMPEIAGKGRSARKYVEHMVRESLESNNNDGGGTP